MKPYPHTYAVSADASATGKVSVASPGLPVLETAPPPEFDGPGGVWSPETLLVAAIADCFILTFRGVSRAVHFDWVRLEAHVDGTLERASGVTQFVRYTTRATTSVVRQGIIAGRHFGGLGCPESSQPPPGRDTRAGHQWPNLDINF